jgi:hypothetical protein
MPEATIDFCNAGVEYKSSDAIVVACCKLVQLVPKTLIVTKQTANSLIEVKDFKVIIMN